MSWVSVGRIEQIGPRRVRVVESPEYYDDRTGDTVKPAVGFESDGTTFPEILHRLTGHPLHAIYLPASVGHDWDIHTKQSTWLRVHTRYYRMLRDSGVSRWRSVVMGLAVLCFGPRWTW